MAQGRENAKQYLRENPDVADQLEAIVREQIAVEEENSTPATEEAGELE
jgi:hypothetical protein